MSAPSAPSAPSGPDAPDAADGPDARPFVGPAILTELAAVLAARRTSAPAGSYSATLLQDPVRATRKIMEESYELSHELTRPVVDPDRVASEAADLVFHLLAGVVGAGVDPDAVWRELSDRAGAPR